jgi:hypothetical protein
VKAVFNELISDILGFVSTYGGSANYDYILLAGGGSGLFDLMLRDLLGHDPNGILTADDIKRIHLANAAGGGKWYRLHEKLGSFS